MSEGRKKGRWDRYQVRALRSHLGLSQQGLARQMGTRQQTISDWETGVYQPRGTSHTLLTIIAERAGFDYASGAANRPQEGTATARAEEDSTG